MSEFGGLWKHPNNPAFNWKVKYQPSKLNSKGGGDSSVVRAPDSWLKGRGFESLLERRENFLLQGRLSVLTLISVSIPPPCYHSNSYASCSLQSQNDVRNVSAQPVYTDRLWQLTHMYNTGTKHVKDPGHSAKSAGGRLQLNTHTPYVCGFYWTVLRHWSQLVPNMSNDIWGH